MAIGDGVRRDVVGVGAMLGARQPGAGGAPGGSACTAAGSSRFSSGSSARGRAGWSSRRDRRVGDAGTPGLGGQAQGYHRPLVPSGGWQHDEGLGPGPTRVAGRGGRGHRQVSAFTSRTFVATLSSTARSVGAASGSRAMGVWSSALIRWLSEYGMSSKWVPGGGVGRGGAGGDRWGVLRSQALRERRGDPGLPGSPSRRTGHPPGGCFISRSTLRIRGLTGAPRWGGGPEPVTLVPSLSKDEIRRLMKHTPWCGPSRPDVCRALRARSLGRLGWRRWAWSGRREIGVRSLPRAGRWPSELRKVGSKSLSGDVGRGWGRCRGGSGARC